MCRTGHVTALAVHLFMAPAEWVLRTRMVKPLLCLFGEIRSHVTGLALRTQASSVDIVVTRLAAIVETQPGDCTSLFDYKLGNLRQHLPGFVALAAFRISVFAIQLPSRAGVVEFGGFRPTPLDQLLLPAGVFSVAGSAVVFTGTGVKASSVLPEPTDFPVTLETAILDGRLPKSVALDAAAIPVEGFVCSGKRARRDLCEAVRHENAKGQ